MKTIVEGVLAGALPWGLVLSGGGLAVGILAVQRVAARLLDRRVSAARQHGGDLRRAAACARSTNRAAKTRPASGGGDPGVLAASGLVAGEGLAGVLVAGLVATGLAPRSLPPRIPGAAGELAALLTIGVVCWFLLTSSRSRPPARSRG